MVIFDRIERDSDCSFINSSSEKNSVQIGEAPLAKLTEIQPFSGQREIFQKSKCLSSKNKTQTTTPLHGMITLTCTSVIPIHGFQNIQRKCLGDTSLWMFCVTHSHQHAVKWKMGFFQHHLTTRSPWRTVLQNWRWCREAAGRKMSGLALPQSTQIKSNKSGCFVWAVPQKESRKFSYTSEQKLKTQLRY